MPTSDNVVPFPSRPPVHPSTGTPPAPAPAPPAVYPPRERSVDGSARDFTAELNHEQAAAATHGAGPLLVIAGAGTGKTRTLVYRVALLIERGVAPERILLLTFTRRA